MPLASQAAFSLSDPAGSSVLLAAVGWLQATLLGTLATTIAVIAVAWVGLLTMTGRLAIRRGLTTVAGCFVLFGASAIAGGLQASLGRDVAAVPPLATAPPPPPMPAPPPPRPVDPYAGASMPGR